MDLRAAALVVLLAASACGSDGSDGDQALPAAGTVSPAGGSCPPEAQLPSGAADHGAAPAAGSEVRVDADDLFFAPTCLLDLAPGTVELIVANVGQSLHNVKIPDQGIDTDVAAGETVTVEVEVGDNPLNYVCKYHSTAGMEGVLVPASPTDRNGKGGP